MGHPVYWTTIYIWTISLQHIYSVNKSGFIFPKYWMENGISKLHELIIQVIVLNISKRWQRWTHSYNSADIKPILESGILIGKSIFEIENALPSSSILIIQWLRLTLFSLCELEHFIEITSTRYPIVLKNNMNWWILTPALTGVIGHLFLEVKLPYMSVFSFVSCSVDLLVIISIKCRKLHFHVPIWSKVILRLFDKQ